MSCKCPEINNIPPPTECQFQIIPIESVRLYPDFTAKGGDGNLLGQWEYNKAYQVVKIYRDKTTIGWIQLTDADVLRLDAFLM